MIPLRSATTLGAGWIVAFAVGGCAKQDWPLTNVKTTPEPQITDPQRHNAFKDARTGHCATCQLPQDQPWHPSTDPVIRSRAEEFLPGSLDDLNIKVDRRSTNANKAASPLVVAPRDEQVVWSSVDTRQAHLSRCFE